MSRRYLLDTNVLSVLIRTPGLLAQRISTVGESGLCTSIVVACELRLGAQKKGSRELAERVDRLLEALDVLPLEKDVDRHYAIVRHRLEAKGRPMGGNDLLIAAHALQKACILVTRNQKEFQRVPGLEVEDWLGSRRR